MNCFPKDKYSYGVGGKNEQRGISINVNYNFGNNTLHVVVFQDEFASLIGSK
ncbi:hypothetical protein RO3G_05058 [Rhizopus delemar RA 99-880]|uniref:Uncharacterized protein n=1 Tax=Rhizopus delemar (strain RA 99-880 / ATCC MYA-4621 / FGSC 9543 / NRRL 43880) TaxID=246409 RepID=I1BVX3_RHIO9|nr:hypothetical protein RO3G_05058 [Rhizopus delemar RA 99-880]|eukprot:EIE80353.1 hypothetical protein RO3G_05058 [Rhizopus delemar RA 99-880]